MASKAEAELLALIRECEQMERTVKPNKARRSWRDARIAAEEELERRNTG